MTAKYWGEEKEEEAVYAVYLRKVRYRVPTSKPVNEYGSAKSYYISAADDSFYSNFDECCDHLQWETVKERVLKAGSLQKLVNALVIRNEGEVDARHFNVFFATYRAFSNPASVLRTILAEIYIVLSELNQIPKRQFDNLLKSWHNILLWWIDLYPDDFRDHPNYNCLTHLIEFTRVQQGIFQDLFIKCVRRRDEFSRSLTNPNAYQTALERFVLSSPSFENGATAANYALVNSRSSKLPDVCHIDCTYVAEQLTYWDAEIFKRLVPHQCQSCFWSRRNKNDQSSSDVYTVKATIDQFNAVSKRVMSTVVHLIHVKNAYRARVIAAWIDIAQELRILKNYSSLKAVLSGLQTESVYRLKNVWNLVPPEKVKEFNELSKLFSEDDNYNGARLLLEKEGTAKVVVNVQNNTNCNSNNSEPQHRRHYKHRRTKSDVADIQGTVPYLGTFLTDLTMIDSANPDFIEDGLINFDKRRKEFEIIAQLRLFQSAARNYQIACDSKFRIWFLNLPCLNEEQCYHCSCVIESPYLTPAIVVTKEKRSGTWSKLLHFWDDPQTETNHLASSQSLANNSNILNFNKNDDTKKLSPALTPPNNIFGPFSSNLPTPNVEEQRKNSRNSGNFLGRSTFYDSSNQFNPESFWNDYYQKTAIAEKNNNDYESRDCLSNDSSFSKDQSSLSSPTTEIYGSVFHQRPSDLTSLDSRNNNLKFEESGPLKRSVADDDCYVIKVGLEDSLQSDPNSQILYKSVKVHNSDRTPKLIDKVLRKHQINADSSMFSIVQLLPDGEELVLPDRGNAFYAIRKVKDLNFIIRKKLNNNSESNNLRVKKKRKKVGGLMFRWSSGFL